MGQFDIMGFIFLTGFLIIPALGFTAAFVLKPVVEAILELRAAFQDGRSLPNERVESLEAEVRTLRAEVAHLNEAIHFDKQLKSLH